MTPTPPPPEHDQEVNLEIVGDIAESQHIFFWSREGVRLVAVDRCHFTTNQYRRGARVARDDNTSAAHVRILRRVRASSTSSGVSLAVGSGELPPGTIGILHDLSTADLNCH